MERGLRYRRFLGETRPETEAYFSSTELDREYAQEIISVLATHTEALVERGVLSREEVSGVLRELKRLLREGPGPVYEWASQRGLVFEDFFEALESYLYERDRGAAYIALGRSRNDHVAAVLRLYVAETVSEILGRLIRLRRALIEKASRLRGVLVPYFTHQQVAQCGSAANYFLSHEHTMARVYEMFLEALRLSRENPLGSGASAGSLVDIDLGLVSERLCLESTGLPPYYATGSRLFLLYTLGVATLLSTELGRIAEDMIMLNQVVPGALLVSPGHIATSSIMPHKRNLVTLEILRARASVVSGLYTSAVDIYRNVPYGYNLDLQEINRVYVEVVRTLRESIDVVTDFIETLSLDEKRLREYIETVPCWSSDVVEYIALRDRMPVREVYMRVSEMFSSCRSLDRECVESVLRGLGLSIEKTLEILRERPFEKRIEEYIERALKRLSRDEEALEKILAERRSCLERLLGQGPEP